MKRNICLNYFYPNFLMIFCLVILSPAISAATDTIPYTTRTHPYSGWGSTIRGDIHTIGMAGASFGLADTLVGTLDNPAGLAMTLPDTAMQATGNVLYDGFIQNYNESVSSDAVIAGISNYPAGFSLAYWSPYGEGQNYLLPSGEPILPKLSESEFRLSAARLFFDNKLSLGSSIVVGRANRSLVLPNRNSLKSETTEYSVGAVLGVLYQFPRRWLLGLSYSTQMLFINPNRTQTTPGIDQFFQDVYVPDRIGLGAGWVPNRFFRVGFGLALNMGISNAALLKDDQSLVGQGFTVQPRIGGHYLFADFAEFNATIGIGSYLEPSRIQNTWTRLHVTLGVEVNPWVLNLGWAIDKGPLYSNYIYSIGVDFGKLMTQLDLIPKMWHPSPAGLFPRISQLSDSGLARPLVKEWDEKRTAPDFLQVSKDLPKKIENKFNSAVKNVKKIMKSDPKEESEKDKKKSD